MTDHPLESGHPLTDEMCKQIQLHNFNQTDKERIVVVADCMRAAYDKGYADALEDVQDTITCIQRKDSPSIPITLEELKDL